jgi:mannose-1-phosphate guanylyltransferase/phosphomannomutase
VLSASVTLRERARTVRSVIDASTHVGRSALVEGAVVGRNCDIRSHVRIQEGAAVGDEVVLGAQSQVMPGVRIYPYKEVESGAHIHESLIWESRASSALFGKDGVYGLINVDLTPDVAVRLAQALGTALKRESRVVASRESARACRTIKRAMITGLNAAGVDVADLRVLPSAVARHLMKTQGYDAGIHVGISQSDPEMIWIRFFEQPGIQMSTALEKDVEKHFNRRELRRVPFGDIGNVTYPARVREQYAQDLLTQLDKDAIERRAYRVVVDYGYSASSFVLPLMLGPLGIEAVSAHGFTTESTSTAFSLRESIGQAKRLVGAIGADLGAVFDRAGDRLFLVDEQGREIPTDRTLLMFLRLVGEAGWQGKVAVPVTVTRRVEEIASGYGLEVVRTPAAPAELAKAATDEGVVFAAAVGGVYIFPKFLPAYDAVASLCTLLELLAPVQRPLSELVAEVPKSHVVHRQLACPWALKGLVMRVLTEQLKGRELDLTDGIKVLDERGWAEVLPDPDEPLVHIYAEGDTAEVSTELEAELHSLVEQVMDGQESTAAAQISSSG